MSQFGKRLLRRSIAVAIVLGIMGYILAEVFLIVHRMNGGVPDPANDAVRWKTPLTMAGFGVVLQVIFEVVGNALRPAKPLSRSETTVSSDPSFKQPNAPIE